MFFEIFLILKLLKIFFYYLNILIAVASSQQGEEA